MPTGLIAINIVLLGLAGPWGQSVKLSGELLNYASAHPQQLFVSDNRTLTEMYVLNGFKPVPNVRRLPGTGTPKFWSAEALPSSATENGPIQALFNPLNGLERNDSFSVLSNRLGVVVYEGGVHYRMLTYLLPSSYRHAHAWTIRIPATQVRIYQIGGVLNSGTSGKESLHSRPWCGAARKWLFFTSFGGVAA